jgi:hypothetical protein
MTKPYSEGGLQMVDIENHINALKINWIKRLIFSIDTPWVCLFNDTIKPIVDITKLGPLWYKSSCTCLENVFWTEVFFSWNLLLSTHKCLNSIEILETPLWYNPQISSNTWFNKKLYRLGLIVVRDILDENANLLNLNQLKLRFDISNMHFLEYLQLKNCVTKFLKNQNYTPVNDIIFPVIPSHIKIACTKTKDIHTFLNTNQPSNKYKEKWCNELNLDVNEQFWKNVFKINHYHNLPNYLAWFQFKVINRILGTNEQQFKIGIRDEPYCPFCPYPQSIVHCLITCVKVKPIWLNFQIWLQNNLDIYFVPSPINIIFGTTEEIGSIILNNLVIVTKHAIFSMAQKRLIPSWEYVFKKLKTYAEEQHLLTIGKSGPWEIINNAFK